MAITEEQLQDLAERLTAVGGVVAVLLGGSRARGEHTAESDHDLGIYYRPPLDVAGLQTVAATVAGPLARVTRPGEWGPWVDGGAWLRIQGSPVDWIYRDVTRVEAAWAAAQEGRFGFHTQVGHPLGVPDFSYAGEVALGRVLSDPTGRLTDLHEQTQDYPAALTKELVRLLWEAGFLVDIARKALVRGDTTYVAGCLFRAMSLCAHALHGSAGRWLINEKGAVAAAGRLSIAPAGFAERAQAILGELGTDSSSLAAAVSAARELVDATAVACSCSGQPR